MGRRNTQRFLVEGVALGLWLFAACANGIPGPDDTPIGQVTSPAHGEVVVGDPSEVRLHVAGTYENDDLTRDLRVQVLSDPNDITSWVTVATTRANIDHEFAVDLQPMDASRWPAGGVFRLRVIDPDGDALDVEGDRTGVLGLVNPTNVPGERKFLIEKLPGTPDETLAYYAAIGAPATLAEFKSKFGFPGNEVVAVYYNAGDLGIGREMHCNGNAGLVGGELACYVRNFGTFGGTREQALIDLVAARAPLATVAMVYSPPLENANSVQFMVYGADDTLVKEAQLDTQGSNKSIPQNCLNCHGGRSYYDPGSHAVVGARFLPFDPASFAYARRDDLSFAAQEAKIRQLDKMIAAASPPGAVRELVNGMFPSGQFDPDFVPKAWQASGRDARVYREGFGRYCRSCHATFTDDLNLVDADAVREHGQLIVSRICTQGENGMPAAEQASRAFFNSPARALLLTWLGQPGACAP